jgi:hypothetical protein
LVLPATVETSVTDPFLTIKVGPLTEVPAVTAVVICSVSFQLLWTVHVNE